MVVKLEVMGGPWLTIVRSCIVNDPIGQFGDHLCSVSKWGADNRRQPISVVRIVLCGSRGSLPWVRVVLLWCRPTADTEIVFLFSRGRNSRCFAFPKIVWLCFSWMDQQEQLYYHRPRQMPLRERAFWEFPLLRLRLWVYEKQTFFLNKCN